MPDNNQQQPASTLPWQTGSGLQPWQVGQVFVGPDGKTLYQVYADSSSPTGYVLKVTDANGGVSFSTGPSPSDPGAYATWYENSPWGQRAARAEAAQAEQNAFNQSLQERQLQLQQDNAKNNFWVQRQQVENARQQLRATLRGQDLNAGYQALSLGASLRGPRDLWAYDRTAAAAGSNPLISNAVSTWANATNNRPTGGGSWNGGNPERMTPQALVSDMQGNGAGAYTAPGSVTAMGAGGGKQETLRALDEIARNPHRTSANWWSTLDPDQQQMAMGAWEELGHNPTQVLARYGNSRIKQGVSGTRAA